MITTAFVIVIAQITTVLLSRNSPSWQILLYVLGVFALSFVLGGYIFATIVANIVGIIIGFATARRFGRTVS